jgi:hypothetical protein
MTRCLPALFVLFALVLIGCTPKGDGGKKDMKVAQDGSKNKKDSPEVKNVAPAKPDFEVTAESIAKEFMTDAKAAGAKYDKKYVEVTGEVNRVEQGDAFTFKGAKKDKGNFDDAWVGCYVLSEDAPKSAQLSEGQKVKVVGKFKELRGPTVTLNDCKVFELEPSKLLMLSAEDVAKEFEKDAKAATGKYKEKHAVVSGMLEDVREGSRPFAIFKGTGKTRVAVEMKQGEGSRLKKGQSTTVRGTFEGAAFKDNEAKMHSGLFVQSR